MGHWSRHDSDEGRLPEGMQRVGYDANAQTNTYRDQDSSFWQEAPGGRYGLLQRTGRFKEREVLKKEKERRICRADTMILANLSPVMVYNDQIRWDEIDSNKPRTGSIIKRP
ncbi:hypothetical protein NA56DRAFT_704898 [Hyaloscypha hepaticicola]|uniref:Uncharacterized protein n=1 Tax=Hyaloscypha hepaticicola TaxID=2082293 RepID=A0A2J6Q1D5_9HELO|nr:hypothetical protein NA56DRAFT_704898 [Hyaloscypha hepaticicola]